MAAVENLRADLRAEEVGMRRKILVTKRTEQLRMLATNRVEILFDATSIEFNKIICVASLASLSRCFQK